MTQPLTVGAVLDAISAVPSDTPVATEDGDLLTMPMEGFATTADVPVELTVVPMPPEAGQSQTAADVATLLAAWSKPDTDTSVPGPDSLLVLAPFGAPASAIVAVAHTATGLVLHTQPL